MNSPVLRHRRRSPQPDDIRACRVVGGFAPNTPVAAASAMAPVNGRPADNAERRQAIRRAPGMDEPLSRLRVRAGLELAVIDLSAAGALVESLARPLPGSYVDVRISTGESHMMVRSRVVRAHVCHVEAHLVRYRAAIAFDPMIETAIPRGSHVP